LKGYATFILFFLLSTMLLLPHTLPPKNNSLSPAYSAHSALSQQIAFKRTILPSAQYAYDFLKPYLEAIDSAAPSTAQPIKFTFASSSFSIAAQAAKNEAKKEIIRAAILSQWQKNLIDANTNDFSFEIYCKDYSEGFEPPPPPTTSPAPALWEKCASHITFYEDKLTNKTIVKLDTGIFTKATHLPTGTSSQGEFFPAELN